ncbi:hypothetical protein TWF281_010356 [Arthrobotrys megalospora]
MKGGDWKRKQKRYTRDLKLRVHLIDAVCRASGAAGLSCGVIYDEEVIFYHNYGFRDVEKGAPCDENTIYAVGSLTKGITAAACAIAVQDNRLKRGWNTRIGESLPGVKFLDGYINKNLTLQDILCQRSGLANPATLWLGKDNEILLADDREKLILLCNNLPSVDDFRTTFGYNNLLYSLAGQLIGHVYGYHTSAGYIRFVQDKIFEPLGLTRTSFDVDPSDKNVAKGYATLDSGELVELRILPYPGLDSKSGGILAPCGGVRSSLKDMLKWINALMGSAWNDDISFIPYGRAPNNISTHHRRREGLSFFTKMPKLWCLRAGERPSEETTPHNDTDYLRNEKLRLQDTILEKSTYLLAAHNAGLGALALDRTPLYETSYACGWCRQSTPAKFSISSKNRDLVPNKIPLIGAGEPSRLVISHIGNLPGFGSMAMMIPELRLGLVVLTNSATLGDVADWVSQVLLEAILCPEAYTDFEKLAREAAYRDKESFKKCIELPYLRGRDIGGARAPLEDFVGTYYAFGGTFKLAVRLKPSSQVKPDTDPQLVLRIADKDSQSYDLSYYASDQWGFLPGERDMKAHAIPYQCWESFILKFQREANGKVYGVLWKIEEGMDTLFERDGCS